MPPEIFWSVGVVKTHGGTYDTQSVRHMFLITGQKPRVPPSLSIFLTNLSASSFFTGASFFCRVVFFIDHYLASQLCLQRIDLTAGRIPHPAPALVKLVKPSFLAIR